MYFGPDKFNQDWGHVGISLGNGKMISALAKVEVTDVAKSSYWRGLYVGWADAPSTWPGRIPPSPGPTTVDPRVTVQITAPAFGSILTGTEPVVASVTGASAVQFYAYYASDPGNASTRAWHPLGPAQQVNGVWFVDWDTSTVPDQGNPAWGLVTITAVALSGNGATTATRDYRQFSVHNAPGPPPPGGQGSPPRGALLFANRISASSARVIGWAQDADNLSAAVSVTALVDGASAGQALADQPSNVGPYGFDFVAATDENQRVVCIWGTNIGPGADAQIGNCLTIWAFGDLNADGAVNCTDLNILTADYGQTGGVADLNGDGTVNVFDFSIMLSLLSSKGVSCS